MWWTRWGRDAPDRCPGRAAAVRVPPGRRAEALPSRTPDRFAADAEGRAPERDAEALLPGRVAPLRARADALRLEDDGPRATPLGADRVTERDEEAAGDAPRVRWGATARGRLALAARETVAPRAGDAVRPAVAPRDETGVRARAADAAAPRVAAGAVRTAGARWGEGADRTAGADRAGALRATGARLGADRAAGAPRRTGRFSAWVSAEAAAASAVPLPSITPTGASRSAARAVPDSPQSTRLSQGRMRVVRDLSVMVSSSQVALGSPGGTEAGGVHSQKVPQMFAAVRSVWCAAGVWRGKRGVSGAVCL